jgi:ketosteroid isomerase-like protein
MEKLIAALMFLPLVALSASSQAPPAKDEAVHNELRALRDGLIDAMNKGDIDRELTFMHPNVVVTWHNAEVSRGRDGVRAYLTRMLSGPDRIVSSYSATVAIDELTILYGGSTGISFGSAIEHFKLNDGRTLDLPARWSATVVKDGDKWLIASLHASDNLFDNPLLAMAKRTAYWAGGVALVVGLIAGFAIGRRRKGA